MMDNHNTEYRYFRLIQPQDANAVLIDDIKQSNRLDNNNFVIPIKWDNKKWLFSMYEKPYYIVNDKLGKLIERFEFGIEKKPIALTDTDAQFMELYWILKYKTIQCKSNQVQIMVSEKEIENKIIFKIKKGLKEYLIVHRNLAEEILKAGFADIEFEGVSVYE